MKKKTGNSKNKAIQVLSMILFWAVVIGAYFGISFLYGLTLHRVYGKTADSLTELAREEDWEDAASSVINGGRHSVSSNVPESLEPYIVILIPESRTADEKIFWDVLAYTGEDKTSLDEVQTIVFCRYTLKTALYNASGTGTYGSTGKSQFVDIGFVNAKTGEAYHWESYGKELPGSASRTPDYKVSKNKLLSHIKKQISEISKEE